MKKDRIAALDEQVIRFAPRSLQQKQLVESIWSNDITVAAGAAGSGKTALSIQTLLDLLKQRYIRKILIIRLITDTCEEHLGALPGEKDEKLLPYMGPILDNLSQILKAGELKYLLDNQIIEVLPVSHARGRTFIDTGVIVEEAQNLSDHMVLTLLTRIGSGSKMIINGDADQVDVYGRNGIAYALRLLNKIDGIGIVQMGAEDIVRHPLIATILQRAKALQTEKKFPLAS